MKFKNISIYALTMAAGMGLWSCTSDEALSGGEAYGEPIPVTITLSRGDAQTRTELSENAKGGLDDKWLRNDQLVVINSNNEEVGVLKFVKYVDDSKPNEAVFQGTLEGVADGIYDYTLWYLGGNGTQQTSLSVFANDYETDGGYPMLVKTTLTQQTGKFDDLVRGDLLSKQIKIRVSDHKAAVEHSLDAASRTMTAHLAMASIKLDGVDGVTDGTLKISHAPSNIDPWYDVYFNRVTSNTRAKVSAVDHPLIINGVNTSSPVYIVLNPAQYSGDTALVLTLTSGDKTWTATLPDIPMEAGKYYRNGADGNQFSVTMVGEETPISDGKFFGIKWAEVNDRSWIDCSLYDDNAFYFTYIPGIQLAEQGLDVKYTSEDMVKGTNNPYVYHYQWGRNFGFPASTGYLINTYVPNHLNLPLSWPNKYNYYSIGQGTATPIESIQNPDTYIYTSSNVLDWCNQTLNEWPVYDENGELLSVVPKGFRMPTREDFLTLLPTGESGKSFTASKSFVVENQTIRPFYSKIIEDGTTVVWTILNSSTNYLALYKLKGSYTLDTITSDVMSSEDIVLDYIDFPAHGCRNATSGYDNLQYFNSSGWYWSGTSDNGRASMFRFDISSNTITLYVATMPKRCAMSVRCIYN